MFIIKKWLLQKLLLRFFAKNRKLSFFISKIQVMEDVYKKLRIKPIFIKIASFKNSNPDSVWVNSRSFDPRDSHKKSSLLIFGQIWGFLRQAVHNWILKISRMVFQNFWPSGKCGNWSWSQFPGCPASCAVPLNRRCPPWNQILTLLFNSCKFSRSRSF